MSNISERAVNEVGGGGATAAIHDGKHAVNFNFSPLYTFFSIPYFLFHFFTFFPLH